MKQGRTKALKAGYNSRYFITLSWQHNREILVLIFTSFQIIPIPKQMKMWPTSSSLQLQISILTCTTMLEKQWAKAQKPEVAWWKCVLQPCCAWVIFTGTTHNTPPGNRTFQNDLLKRVVFPSIFHGKTVLICYPSSLCR